MSCLVWKLDGSSGARQLLNVAADSESVSVTGLWSSSNAHYASAPIDVDDLGSHTGHNCQEYA